MAKNTTINEQMFAESPVQLSLAAELQALKDESATVVTKLSRRLWKPALAEARLDQIIEKAYSLGGRAEWNRSQAARIERDLGDSQDANEEGVAREVYGEGL